MNPTPEQPNAPQGVQPSATPSTPPTSSSFNSTRVGILAIVLMAVAGLVYGYFYTTAEAGIPKFSYAQAIRKAVVNPNKLAEGYVDEDGDLVADVPKDAAKQVDPEVLNFSTLESNVEKAKAEWKEFLEHLAKVTGKKVELVQTPPGGQGIAEKMRLNKDADPKERLHIATLSTGSVPLAVCTAGYVPVCVMGDKNDNFAYQMEILVAADSKIETPAQIKGKRVTLTSMSSLSGFKAPLMYLWKNENLAPDTDFKITISANQKASIIELKDGQAEIIAVANDYLARVLNSEKIDPKAFRTIYKSPSYPPACFGHANDLKPELAKKIKEAFLTFKWEGTGLEKAYLPANQVKFVEVSYKKDWESVRAIDKDVLEKIGLE